MLLEALQKEADTSQALREASYHGYFLKRFNNFTKSYRDNLLLVYLVSSTRNHTIVVRHKCSSRPRWITDTSMRGISNAKSFMVCLFFIIF
jgi:hypothetical protein